MNKIFLLAGIYLTLHAARETGEEVSHNEHVIEDNAVRNFNVYGAPTKDAVTHETREDVLAAFHSAWIARDSKARVVVPAPKLKSGTNYAITFTVE